MVGVGKWGGASEDTWRATGSFSHGASKSEGSWAVWANAAHICVHLFYYIGHLGGAKPNRVKWPWTPITVEPNRVTFWLLGVLASRDHGSRKPFNSRGVDREAP